MRNFLGPFAASGTRTRIPDTPPVNGAVSYPTGYGPDYAGDPEEDPDAKLFPRAQFNSLMFDITEALVQFQNFGFAPWVPPSENGGTPKTYAKGATVIWNGGAGADWTTWTANVATDDQPGTSGEWSSGGLGSFLTKTANLADLDDAAAARGNLGLGSMATQPAGDFLTKNAPSSTGGFTQAGGTKGNLENVAIAAGAGTIEVNKADGFLATFAANTTFTFTGWVDGALEVKVVRLVITGGAQPTFTGAWRPDNGQAITFTNGTHIVAFIRFGTGAPLMIVPGKNYAA